MENLVTYYTLLDVQQDATEEDIKKAFFSKYRTLQVKVADPDPIVAEKAQQILRQLQEAQSTLLDPQKRANYDKLIQNELLRRREEAIEREKREQEALQKQKELLLSIVNQEIQKRDQSRAAEHALKMAEAEQKLEQANKQGCANSWGAKIVNMFVGAILTGACLGTIFLKNFGSGIWLGLLSFLVQISALTGLLPVFGVFIHHRILVNWVLPWWFESSGLASQAQHWLIKLVVGFSYLQAILITISAIVVVIQIIIAIKSNKD